LLSSGALGLPDDRNAGAAALQPLTQRVRQIGFANTRAFQTYKVSFSAIKTASAAMLQIGEVELLGAPAVPVLTFTQGATPGTLTLNSTVSGRLWSAEDLQGTNTIWQDAGPISGSVNIATPQDSPRQFFKVSAP
ncbi:MAG TPA: hypothetical protein VN673_03125, partial [Clostridia bacterium]|nr:hypothetical protein [Clostridia bacterium]